MVRKIKISTKFTEKSIDTEIAKSIMDKGGFITVQQKHSLNNIVFFKDFRDNTYRGIELWYMTKFVLEGKSIVPCKEEILKYMQEHSANQIMAPKGWWKLFRESDMNAQVESFHVTYNEGTFLGKSELKVE